MDSIMKTLLTSKADLEERIDVRETFILRWLIPNPPTTCQDRLGTN
eukprot:COSAG06_NODE_6668_length_2834_cov_3.785009_2_plen_46_part_00